jgi:hypothetical protein
MYLSEGGSAAYTGIPRDRIAYHAPRWNFKPDAHYRDKSGVHPLYKQETLDEIRECWERHQAERKDKGLRTTKRGTVPQDAQSPVRDGAM